MPTQEFISKFTADTTELEQAYAKIKTLEEEQAARSAILTENTLKIKKKALREEEEVLQTLIASNSKNAEGQAEIDKKREESIKKIKELKGEVDKLTPATQNVTKAQEQLGKTMKRVESTLRGFAITAAIAFGAAILKGVVDFAKGLFEASKATQAINAAMEEFTKEAGKALGSMREQFTELKKLTPGTQAWKNEIEKVNKQYGDMIKLGVDATLADIEAAERKLTEAITDQIREETRREALRKAFGDAESARLAVQIAKQKGQSGLILEALESLADEAEETARSVEKALEPSAFERIADVFADPTKGLGALVAGAVKGIGDESQKASPKIKELKEEINILAGTLRDILPEFDALFGETEDDGLRARAEELTEQIQELGGFVGGLPDEITPEFIEFLEGVVLAREQEVEAHRTQVESNKELDEQQAESDAEALKTLEENNAKRVASIKAVGSTLGSLGDAFHSLSEVVGEETEEGAALAKVAALFNIAASQAVAIANIVAMATEVGAAAGPAGPIAFAATLAAGLAVTIANIAAAKQVLDGADLPHHAEGTSATQKGWAVVGERGPEIIKTGKGDAVFNNQAVRTERELIDAINDGTINDLIMRQYVYPAIMAHQVAQKARDKQELKETVSAYFDNAFDDTNLQRIGDRQISILKGIYSRLKPKATPAPRTRF